MTKTKWNQSLNINQEPTCSILSKYINGKKYGCLPENEKTFIENQYLHLIKNNQEKKSNICKRKDELCKLERLINFYLKGRYNIPKTPRQSGKIQHIGSDSFDPWLDIFDPLQTKSLNNQNEINNDLNIFSTFTNKSPLRSRIRLQTNKFDLSSSKSLDNLTNYFYGVQLAKPTAESDFVRRDNLVDDKYKNENEKKIELNNYIKSKLLTMYQTFYKPKKPSEWKLCEQKARGCTKNWINNNNMLEILNQYMLLYENFLFLGVYYINFLFVNKKNINGIYCPLDRFDFDLMNKKKKNVCAMIFNTSSHGKKGEHWIAMVFFWKEGYGEINFFDSYGKSIISPLPDEILIYMKIIYNLGLKYGIKFRCQKSKIIHQKKNGECGVYSLYFIVHSLNNSFDSIVDRISDENMKQYRDIFWRE
jgi:hypothetical protein